MGIVLISLFSIAILVLLVFGLHRYQLSATQSNAESHGPLPPLDDATFTRNLPDLALDDEAETIGIPGIGTADRLRVNTPVKESRLSRTEDAVTEITSREDSESHGASSKSPAVNPVDRTATAPPTRPIPATKENSEKPALSSNAGRSTVHETNQAKHASEPAQNTGATSRTPHAGQSKNPAESNRQVSDIPGNIDKTHSHADDDKKAATSKDSPKPTEDPPTSDADNWLDQVSSLKKSEKLDEALAICRREFPLWSAYQQATLIHRARIKQLLKNNQEPDVELRTLYRVAAQASFLHDRVKDLPDLTLAQLKTLDLALIEELEMPYSSIGYTELRLIKKTDIKLLLEKFGKPSKHVRPREFYSDIWQKLASGQQAALF